MKKILTLMMTVGFFAAAMPVEAKHGHNNGNYWGFGNRNFGRQCGSNGWNNNGHAYGRNWQWQRRNVRQLERVGIISKNQRKFLSRQFNNGRNNGSFWF